MTVAVLVGIVIGYGLCSGDPFAILMDLPQIGMGLLRQLLNTLQSLI